MCYHYKMVTASEALKWAKSKKKFSWVKDDTKVKDLTKTKKALLISQYEKSLEKERNKTRILLEIKDSGRGVELDEVTGAGFKKLTYQKVRGKKAKLQPSDTGKLFYLKTFSKSTDKILKDLKGLSEGYPSEIKFFNIGSLNEKFGVMGEESLSQSKVRKGEIFRKIR